ncbi:MAG: hypothetical protein PUK75_09465 [bacterium]|nr:hypothetical protein [bacterium]MDY4099141.1 hypothetical protein [Lachnospiraceae bacterium]
MGEKIGLSKSRYCKGIQCPKILWMDKYKPEEAVDNLPEAVLAKEGMDPRRMLPTPW